MIYVTLLTACLLFSGTGLYAAIPTKVVVADSIALSAEAARDALSAPEYVWFGLDFAYIKILGDSGFKDVKTPLPSGWNDLLLREKKKFNMQKAFGKKDFIYDFEAVSERNKDVDLDAAIVRKIPPQLTQSQLAEEVARLETEEMTGTGLVFIMELFDKTENQGYMHVVFFDIKSKSILLTTRMSGKARGIGKKNFWANTVFFTLEQMRGVYKGLAKKYSK